MRPGDLREAARLRDHLAELRGPLNLRGLSSNEAMDVLIEQLIESERRNRYVSALRERPLGPNVCDPVHPGFDPLMAAIEFNRRGDIEDAIWMTFLFVHFGKHRKAGWRYAADVYGRLGQGGRWGFAEVRDDTHAFRNWLDQYRSEIEGGPPRGFGNHRKYESLAGWRPAGTGAVFDGYVCWVGPLHDQAARIRLDLEKSQIPEEAFEAIFRSLRVVPRFGRTARFDFLATLSKLELAPIRPGKAYLQGATGPLQGARLLFAGTSTANLSAASLEANLQPIQEALGVGFDVLEDALCNWQKSPVRFVPFRG